VQVVDYVSEKWGGEPHYRSAMEHLGDDEHGVWLWGRARRTIYRGEAKLFEAELEVVTLIPPGLWWAPAWWLGHPEIDLYVNINTPAMWDGDRVAYVDLDLDVVRFTDGRVEEVDRDEFDLHRERYGYPPDIVSAANAAAARALELVRSNAAPFDGVAAQEWTSLARRAGGM